MVIFEMQVIVFFFQAEDGIRDKLVTGVRVLFRSNSTIISMKHWNLPGTPVVARRATRRNRNRNTAAHSSLKMMLSRCSTMRSEERRVGKECRSRWSPDHQKEKRQEGQETHMLKKV